MLRDAERTAEGRFSYLRVGMQSCGTCASNAAGPDERIQTLLIASASSHSLAEAVACARSAVQVADESSRRLFRVLARIALAELVPDERARLLDEGTSIAQELDSEPMRAALAHLYRRDADAAVLAPFVAPYRAFSNAATSIEIRLLAGDAVVNGKTVPLSPAAYAIVAELGQERRWFDAAEIQEDLYPELDGETAANRLYVTIHRLRKRIHRDVIAASRSGYRIGSAATVDLWEAEVIVKEHAMVGGTLRMDQMARVKSLLPMARAELCALAARARLPNGLEFRLTEARRLLLAAAATSALDADDPNESLRFSEALLTDEPCDEDGHSCRIRALLRQSGPAAAQRAWNAYRKALVSAVNAEPLPLATFIANDHNGAAHAR